MNLLKGKFFSKAGEMPKKVYCLPWEEQDTDYYSFLRGQIQSGYRQVITSSEIFLAYIEFAVLTEEYSIVEIAFMEEDAEFSSIVDSLLAKIDRNPAHFYALMKELQFLVEKSSIEIKSVKFKCRIDGNAVQFFIQSNGLIGVNEGAYQLITNKVCRFVEKCLF